MCECVMGVMSEDRVMSAWSHDCRRERGEGSFDVRGEVWEIKRKGLS